MRIMDALERLLSHAYSDTGGSRRCAMFLLSLWNGGYYQADLQELLYVDQQVHKDMMMVMQHLYENNLQLDSLVSEAEMSGVIDMWGKSVAPNPAL